MLKDVLKTPRAQLTIASVVSLIVGGTVVHLVDAKRLETKYADLAEQEIEDAKTYYAQRLALRDEKPGSPAELFAALHPEAIEAEDVGAAADAILQYQGYRRPKDEVVAELVEKTNIFVGKDLVDADPDEVTPADGELDETQVITLEDRAIPLNQVHKDREDPYIISEEIWQEGELGYDQPTLTYYAGDDVLADEKDTYIDNVMDLVGTDNLLRFGEGTDDANTLFVRNNRLKLDMQIVRSDGTYKHEVLGLEHSDDRRQRDHRGPRKFRDQDE